MSGCLTRILSFAISAIAIISPLSPAFCDDVDDPTANKVYVIDAENYKVLSAIAVGASPRGLAVDPRGARVYVANYNDDSVSVINTRSNTVISTVAVGVNPLYVAIDPKGTFLYVTNYGSGEISVIDIARTVKTTVKVSTPAA